MANDIVRSDKDLPELKADATLDDVISHYNDLIAAYNFLNKNISLQSNLDGIVVSVTIDATSNLKVQHFLGVKPKYRIILRQEGNGVITDIPSGWDSKYIELYNNGAVEVTASILIARE